MSAFTSVFDLTPVCEMCSPDPDVCFDPQFVKCVALTPLSYDPIVLRPLMGDPVVFAKIKLTGFIAHRTLLFKFQDLSR